MLFISVILYALWSMQEQESMEAHPQLLQISILVIKEIAS